MHSRAILPVSQGNQFVIKDNHASKQVGVNQAFTLVKNNSESLENNSTSRVEKVIVIDRFVQTSPTTVSHLCMANNSKKR